MRPINFVFILLFANSTLLGDGPADNVPGSVRPIPPEGIEIPANLRETWQNRASKIRERLTKIDGLDETSRGLVSVFPRAVEMSTTPSMLYTDKEVEQSTKLLDLAELKLASAESGKRGQELLLSAPPAQSRLTVGGFRSKIDGSIQPYGIVLPENWSSDPNKKWRLEVWLHGRGEKVSEVAFLTQRQNQLGEFAPPDTIVLHPYGRYCNAFKFAGEIDVLEAIEHVQKIMSIDSQRIVIRGFSMGGAGCWQLAVHYPQLWAAANPGAGFSETQEFLRIFQQEDFKPTAYQQKLLHWYDCPDWTNNLRNVPTVAYSGETDRQKQAADVMEAAYRARGMQLPHIIGPQTAHKILAESKPAIQQFIDDALNSGKPTLPNKVDLTTFYLRYHEMAWLSIEGLQRHWHEAVVHAELGDKSIQLKTDNVTRLRIRFSADQLPWSKLNKLNINVDAQHLDAEPKLDDSGAALWLVKNERGTWTSQQTFEPQGLIKRPGLQGPIDDAFMSAFIFVGPSPSKSDSIVDKWCQSEFEHATSHWRNHFRGDVVAKSADQISEVDLANNNLILFGTPLTNPLIAKIAKDLPVSWKDGQVQAGVQQFESSTHVPVLVYPNPLNPNRYVVVNSGFTFREFAYLNNARQIAMLPDWAIVNVSSGATTQLPGAIPAAGFFDEQWAIPTAQ